MEPGKTDGDIVCDGENTVVPDDEGGNVSGSSDSEQPDVPTLCDLVSAAVGQSDISIERTIQLVEQFVAKRPFTGSEWSHIGPHLFRLQEEVVSRRIAMDCKTPSSLSATDS